MDISAFSKSSEHTERATKHFTLTRPLSRFIYVNATAGWNSGRQHAARFKALAAIHPRQEKEVMR